MVNDDFLFKRDYIRKKLKELEGVIRKTNVPKCPESLSSKITIIQKRYNFEDKKTTGGE